MSTLRKKTIEAIRYGLVSVVAFVVDIGLLALLVRFAHWHYLPAAVTSFVAGGVLAYLLCVRFVFDYRRIGNPAVELPSFVLLGLVGLAANLGIIYVAVELFGWTLPIAKGVASACTLVLNYGLRRLLLFTPTFFKPK